MAFEPAVLMFGLERPRGQVAAEKVRRLGEGEERGQGHFGPSSSFFSVTISATVLPLGVSM